MKHYINLSEYQKKNIFKLSDKFYGKNPKGEELSFTNYYMQINGAPFFVVCGECPITRVDESKWEDSILKMKMAGINTIQSYIVWIHHEENEGIFNFKKSKNIRKFIQLCKKYEMMVILRIGPFIHGEVRNGGIPEWLYGKPFDIRELNEGFLHYTRRWYHELAKQVQGLYYEDGGPIVGIQIENEYGHSASPWTFAIGTTNEWLPVGKSGEKYLICLKKIAQEEGLCVPFYTCTGWGGAPTPIEEMLPMNGAYAYWPWIYYNYEGKHPALNEFIYRDYHNNSRTKMYGFEPEYRPEEVPYSCCEMGVGMTCSYRYRFQVDTRSGDAIANMKIAGGCNFLGYYIFRGGTNPDSAKGMLLNENQNPRKSYDFQAAIGEYGQVRESYQRVKLLHYFVKSYENILCKMGTVLPEDSACIEPEDVKSLRYSIRTDGNSGFLFLNNYQDHVENQWIRNEEVIIKLNSKTINFSGIDLAPGEEAVLPFNMDLSGYRLIYAKAQPLSIYKGEKYTTYFFFTPDGMDGEFVLDGALIEQVNHKRFSTNEIHLRVEKNEIQSYIIQGQKGVIQIVLLSREKSLEFYEYKKGKKKKILLCDCPILFNGKRLIAESRGDSKKTSSISFYEEEKNMEDLISNKVFSQKKKITWRKKAVEPILIPYQKVGEHRYIMNIPKGLDQYKEVLLRIEYEGDVGSLFINGRLVADDFWNGAVWETGLKVYLEELKDQTLTLLINPWKNNVKINTTSEMAGFHEEAEESVERIKSITIQCIEEKDIMV